MAPPVFGSLTLWLYILCNGGMGYFPKSFSLQKDTNALAPHLQLGVYWSQLRLYPLGSKESLPNTRYVLEVENRKTTFLREGKNSAILLSDWRKLFFSCYISCNWYLILIHSCTFFNFQDWGISIIWCLVDILCPILLTI